MAHEPEGTGRLIVTGTGTEGAVRRLRSALRRAVPDARIRSTDFFGVFDLEAEDESEALAQTVGRECAGEIGHLVAVLEEVQSKFDDIRDAAVRAAVKSVAPGESFSFRLHKRGAHYLRRETPEIEPEIGDAVGKALTQAHGTEPTVSLDDPDVTVQAELLGPLTAVGISRKRWRQEAENAD